jgi:hypothetical protein
MEAKALKESSIVAVAAVASALASVFFAKWTNQFGFLEQRPG